MKNNNWRRLHWRCFYLLNFQNSLNHRQAISTALDESFATVLDFGPEEFSSSSEDEKQQSDHHHDNTVRNLNSTNNKENVLISDEDAEEPKVNLAPNVILKENVPVFISNELTPEVKGSEDLIPKIKAEEVITDIEPVLIPKVRETTAADLTPKTRSKVVPDLQQDLEPS